MNYSINKVFENEDLKNIIFKFIINKRCIQCHHILHFKGEHKKYKDYTNRIWCTRSNKFEKKCCNWCYYYVWEYPMYRISY